MFSKGLISPSNDYCVKIYVEEIISGFKISPTSGLLDMVWREG
jgi:hypothetical protein